MPSFEATWDVSNYFPLLWAPGTTALQAFQLFPFQFSYDIQFTIEYCFWSILVCKEIRISCCQGEDSQCLYSLQHSYSLYAKTSHYQMHTKKQSNQYLISSCLHIKNITVNHQQILFQTLCELPQSSSYVTQNTIPKYAHTVICLK